MGWFVLGVVVGVFIPVSINLLVKDLIMTVWSKIMAPKE